MHLSLQTVTLVSFAATAYIASPVPPNYSPSSLACLSSARNNGTYRLQTSSLGYHDQSLTGVPGDGQPWNQDLNLLRTVGINPEDYGLPPLDPNDPAPISPCLADLELLAADRLAACPPNLYFEGVIGRPPIFRSWTSPAYANDGFMLLGIALANITGKSLDQLYSSAVFNPLRMSNSTSEVPPQPDWSQCVISGNDTSLWAVPTSLSVSSGGIFSTINDLAKLGTAILNSTLLPSNKTRQWMKPVSHTASLEFSVGAPWEIYRYTHSDAGAVTDIYTKIGDANNLTGYATLLLDYDAGFNILTAGSTLQKSNLAATIANMITTTMIPTLETQAFAEAESNFAGTYRSNPPDLNSSLTLTVNKSSTDPGL
ncbi:uncharacterized protein PAC_15744 [Phialocephala subalpina]|uniref:Beta-lactamase-related domain-containing protein n=1 Tax=Phialocephala subalpina TaxID=576137 RepID=A0A1L7XLF8_9HELO|nr:uncharacterized protein PAC_15744 [Phialocephala subalpina]